MCLCMCVCVSLVHTSGCPLCRDMVKKLINKMDVQALEVKMKKCKVSWSGQRHSLTLLYSWQERLPTTPPPAAVAALHDLPPRPLLYDDQSTSPYALQFAVVLYKIQIFHKTKIFINGLLVI